MVWERTSKTSVSLPMETWCLLGWLKLSLRSGKFNDEWVRNEDFHVPICHGHGRLGLQNCPVSLIYLECKIIYHYANALHFSASNFSTFDIWFHVTASYCFYVEINKVGWWSWCFSSTLFSSLMIVSSFELKRLKWSTLANSDKGLNNTKGGSWVMHRHKACLM